MNRHFARDLILAALTTSLTVAPAKAAERAGETKRSQQNAYQVEIFSPDTLEVGDEIYREATVFTKDHGSLELAFDDGSLLTLGPNTDLVIDDFVYSPDSGNGQAALRLGRGVLRMVSGNLPSERVQIATDVATVGIRGTRFTLDTHDEGILQVWSTEGTVVVSPRDTDIVYELVAPSYASCTSAACTIGPAPVEPVTFPTSPPNPGPFGESNERDDGHGNDDESSSSFD